MTQEWWTAIRRLVGLRAWNVWFDSDTHFCLLAIFYSVLLSPILDLDLFIGTLYLVALLELYLALGTLISDYFDMPYDRAAGKSRTIFYMKKWQIYGLMSILTFFGFAVAIVLIGRLDFILIYVIAHLIALLYCAPPLRLKSRGIHGIWSDALGEKTIPAVLVFLYFQHLEPYTYFFIMLCFVAQVEAIIRHQIGDYSRDVKTFTRTFVVEIGEEKATRLLNRYLRPTLTFLILILGILVSVRSPYFVVFFGTLLVGFFFIQKLIETGRITPEDRRSPTYFTYWYFSLASVYPISLGFLSTLLYPPYALLLLFALFSQHRQAKYYLKLLRAVLPSAFKSYRHSPA